MQFFEYKKQKEQIKEIITKRKLIEQGVEEQVRKIVEDIRGRGDEALIEYIKKFDDYQGEIIVSQSEIQEAKDAIDEKDKEILNKVIFEIRNYSEFEASFYKSHIQIFSGSLMGFLYRPIEKVGIYIPGGRYPLVSSLIMGGVYAKTAGVKRLFVATPPQKNGKINPYILYLCDLFSVERVYKMGGAHAIGALAFSTKTVEKVDKIIGPGGLYTTAAKRLVWGFVDIDLLAGPTELVVFAEEEDKCVSIVYELLAQAEHDPFAICFLISSNINILKGVFEAIEKEVKNSNEINIFFIKVENTKEAVCLIDEIAPEHLLILNKNPLEIVDKINNAGVILINTPCACSDYFAGPSHILPTSGGARFFSPLNIGSFLHKVNLIWYDKKELKRKKELGMRLAEIEGLFYHKLSLQEGGGED